MRVSSTVFFILVLFFLPVALIYGFFTQWDEPVGFVGLLLSAGLSGFIAFYLWLTSKRLDPAPDDNPAGEIYEAEGDYGFFSPHSWWPLAVGLSGAFVFLGVAVGWWMVIIAAPLLAIATVGWTMEYFRGDNAL